MKRRRNSLRHPDHDYTRPGAYFITICAYKGNALFGQIVDGVMQLNPLGLIAHQAWLDLPKRHSHLSVDPFVIMPTRSPKKPSLDMVIGCTYNTNICDCLRS